MLKESCPYHKGPIKHTLGECDMLRCFYNKPGPRDIFKPSVVPKEASELAPHEETPLADRPKAKQIDGDKD
jgi:hypothetical protein